MHVDHLNRPVMLTDSAKTIVWWASYEPFGKVRATGGTLSQNLGLPGQWFQIENGLAYNWHRHYDPTTGRYTTADPLGFVDGPSVFAYAGNAPHRVVDPSGEWVPLAMGIGVGLAFDFALDFYKRSRDRCEGTQFGKVGNAALGGAIGGFGPFETKPRVGIAGGGKSGNKTSSFSNANHAASRAGYYPPAVRNALTGVGRKVPYVGYAIAGYEVYDAIWGD